MIYIYFFKFVHKQLHCFKNFTHELLTQGTYGLLAEFPMGKKNNWATVGHGFGLISRGKNTVHACKIRMLLCNPSRRLIRDEMFYVLIKFTYQGFKTE